MQNNTSSSEPEALEGSESSLFVLSQQQLKAEGLFGADAPTCKSSLDTGALNGRRLSLKRNFAWTSVGNLIYAGSQWAIVAILAKMGTPEVVGQFTLGLAVSAPVFLLFNLNLRSLQATDACQEFDFRHYFLVRLVSTLLALMLVAVVCVYFTLQSSNGGRCGTYRGVQSGGIF